MTDEMASRLCEIILDVIDKVFTCGGPGSLSQKSDIEELLEAGKEMIKLRNAYNNNT